jgi:hypothetical protein
MVSPILRRAFDMLPEGGKTAVRSILKPRVELARVIAVLDAMPRRTVRLTNVQESVTGQPVGAADDRELTERLLKAYRLADGESIETGASMWSDFFRDLHGDLHRTFMSGSIADVQAVLRNPGATNLFYGFDSLSRDLLLFAKSARWRRANALAIADSLVRLSEILGARLYPNSEAIANGYGRSETIDATQCLPEIDAALGLRLDVPTPFPDEHGLATDRGVISYRTPQAIYQAMRIRQMTTACAIRRCLRSAVVLGGQRTMPGGSASWTTRSSICRLRRWHKAASLAAALDRTIWRCSARSTRTCATASSSCRRRPSCRRRIATTSLSTSTR